jgi:hypothetical protein
MNDSLKARDSKEQVDPNNGSERSSARSSTNTVTTLFVGEKQMISMPTWFFRQVRVLYWKRASSPRMASRRRTRRSGLPNRSTSTNSRIPREIDPEILRYDSEGDPENLRPLNIWGARRLHDARRSVSARDSVVTGYCRPCLPPPTPRRDGCRPRHASRVRERRDRLGDSLRHGGEVPDHRDRGICCRT